jgi:hypothetical protein
MRWLFALALAGLAACSSGDGGPRAERTLPEPITVSSPEAAIQAIEAAATARGRLVGTYER